MNRETEIKHRLLDVCKVKGWDSDINIVGFHALCDELKALGADDEREACEALCKWRTGIQQVDAAIETCEAAIRARGNT